MSESRIAFLEEQARWHKEKIKEVKINLQSLEDGVAKLEEELQRLQNNKEHV